MDDLRRRFGSLDRVPAPDLWTEIEGRAMALDSAGYAAVGVRRSRPMGARRRSPLLLVGMAALLLALVAGLTILVGSLLRESQRTLPLIGTFTATGPMVIPRVGDDFLAVTLEDGRVLVMGGHRGEDDSLAVQEAELFDPSTGTFSATGTMHEAHGAYSSATVLADGRVLVVGGWHPTEDGLAPVGAEVYDPGTGEFTEVGPMAVERYGHTATLLADGRVLIAGGNAPTAGGEMLKPPAEIFDPRLGTFTRVESPPSPRMYHAAARLTDGRVLLVGGYGAPGPASALFDPATETFTSVGAMVHERISDLSATLLEDGRVLVVGGEGGGDMGALSSAELFDPATGTFSETGSLTTNRQGHEAVRLSDGRVLVTGGYNVEGSPRGSEIYDPSTGRFELGAVAERPGQRAAALLPDGRVFVVGGDTSVGEVTPATPIAEVFDPAASSSVTVRLRPGPVDPFQPVSAISDRLGQTATVLADGRVLIVGGGDLDAAYRWGHPTDAAVIYDPSTGDVTETGAMHTRRVFHSATLLPDGRVMIAGGDGPEPGTDGPDETFTSLASVEIYDPLTGTFAESAPMVAQRGPSASINGPSRHLALLVGDGRVLLAGGVSDRSSERSKAMELYDPVTETSTRLPGACPGGFRHDVVGQAVDDGRVLLTCGESARLFDPSAEAFSRLPAEWPSDWGIPVAGQVILATGGTGMVVIVDPKTHQVSVSDPFGGDGPAAEALAPFSVMQTAVRLRDGRVLIVGRSAREVWRGMATILDPVTGEVTRLQPLGARWSPVVTELLDGRILITGHPSGSPDHYEPRPPAAEILDPSRVP